MPRLIEYVSFGFCSGYGDGDYRISAAIADLSPERMQELRAIAVSALYHMEDMWRSARVAEQQGQKNTEPLPSSPGKDSVTTRE